MAWGIFTDYEEKLRALIAEVGDNPPEIIRQFITEHYDPQAILQTGGKVSKLLLEWAAKADTQGEFRALAWATISRCQPDDQFDLSFTDKTFSATKYGRGGQWRVEEHKFKRQRRSDKKRLFQRIADPSVPAVVYVPLFDDRTPIIDVDFGKVRDWD